MRIDKKTKQHLIIGAAVVVVVIIICIIFHVHSVKKVKAECEKVNQQMQDRITRSTRIAYKTTVDIAQGQLITEDLVTVDSNTLDDDSQDLMFTDQDFGKQAVVAIPAGSIVNQSMISDPLDKNWQETELNCVWLSTNLKKYDYVDIRILFPNGTDYVVAAKKSIKKLRLANNNVFFWFTEDEILNLDAAIVDANLHGAKIYTTRYVKPEVEETSKITYQPSATVIDLLNSSPNVLTEAKQHLSKSARADMEQKLQEFKEAETSQKKQETEHDYNFKLDTTTDASTGEHSDNNNGYKAPEDEPESSDSEEPAVDSARNQGTANTGEAGGASNGK